MTELERLIAVARGETPADTVLRGARVFDVVTGDLIDGDVAVCGDRIAGIIVESKAGRGVVRAARASRVRRLLPATNTCRASARPSACQ